MNYCKDLKKITKGKVVLDEPLSRHTTFRIGGPARVRVEPQDIEDLKNILRFIKRKKIQFFVIGEGSNLLVKDKGFNGIIIRLNSNFFSQIRVKDSSILAGGGVKLVKLLNVAKKNALGGCEFLVGIPGSVGGALVMNAGARLNSVFNDHYRSIGDLVKEVEVMDTNGKIKTLRDKKINFGYRTSNLSKFIILGAKLKLKPRNKLEIEQEMNDFLKYKKTTQDPNWRNAGCVFKNPEVTLGNKSTSKLLSAGYLIDACGLKNHRVGGAVISAKHANFIINDKNAKAKDVINLIKFVQKKIQKKFNLSLELELKII